MIDSASRAAVRAMVGQGVLIVGDVMLDEYIWGAVRRISPEAPVPVVEVARRSYRPGGAGNVAANIAALGGRPLLGSVVGQDAGAAQIGRALADDAVDAAGLIQAAERPTTVKSRVIAHSQQMLRLDTEVSLPISAALEEALLAWADRMLGQARVCILSDYGKGVLTPRVCRALIALARQRGLPVVVDPKGRDYAKYAGATVVTPNTHEAAVAAGHGPDAAPELDALAQALLARLGGAALLMTRGAEGMTLYRLGQPQMHIPAYARMVYDVTGAGDTVVATLALALAVGAALERAMALANLAASIVVGKVGTAAVTGAELLAALGEA